MYLGTQTRGALYYKIEYLIFLIIFALWYEHVQNIE